MPTDAMLAHITYQNVSNAIAWLTKIFGFTEHYRYGEPVSGAQMHLGEGGKRGTETSNPDFGWKRQASH